MNERLDAQDLELLAKYESVFNRVGGPRIGDYVLMLDGTERRVTHHWGNTIQTTCDQFLGDSFNIDNGRPSYSGGLDRAIPLTKIEATGEKKPATFWFFSHGRMRAHNGVHVQIPVRVYRVLP